jgi:hypothetical protein
MAGGGDNGVLLGMMAANQARRSGGRGNGGGSMFNVFPLLIIPVIIYAIVAYTTGADMSAQVFSVPMVSGSLPLSKGDLLVILGMIMLFMELIKAAGSGTATIINHGLSMVIFVIAMALFLLVGHFATSTFFLLTLMTLMDTVAGFVVTIVAARRDLAVGGDG